MGMIALQQESDFLADEMVLGMIAWQDKKRYSILRLILYIKMGLYATNRN